MLARQRIVLARIERAKIVARKFLVANDKPGAAEADGGRFFEGKADGLGGGAKAARALGGCSVPVAAEVKLGTSVEV